MEKIKERVVARYLKKEHIKANPKKVNEFLDYHPEYPSLAAFQDLFSSLNVENMGVKLDVDDLQEVEYPIIAHLNEDGGRFVLLEEKNNGDITYFNNGSIVKETVTSFAKKWSGMALLLSKKDEASQGLSWLELIGIHKFTIIAAFLGLMGVFSIIGHLNWTLESLLLWASITLISAAGLGLSYSLNKIERGESSNFGNRFCGQNEKSNCTKVVNSRSGKLFGFLSWSEIGMFFFGGQLVCTFFVAETIKDYEVWNVLSILNLLAVPFSFYSIYLQWFVLKKWCTLCLMVQVLVFLGCVVFLLNDLPNFAASPSSMTLSFVTLSFLIPAIFLTSITGPLRKAKELKNTKVLLERFKSDSDIFNYKLAQSNSAPSKSYPIDRQTGEQTLQKKIILVFSPNCAPCRGAFFYLKNLQSQNPESICLETVIGSLYSESGYSAELVKHFLTMSIYEHPDKINSALTTLFDERNGNDNFKSWIENNPVTAEVDQNLVNQHISDHNEWLRSAKILATPTIFFNGKQLPMIYRVNDLRYHL